MLLFNEEEYNELHPQQFHSFRGTRIAQLNKSDMTEAFAYMYSGHANSTARGAYASLRKDSVRYDVMNAYKELVEARGHSFFPSVKDFTVGSKEFSTLLKKDKDFADRVKKAQATM